MNSKWFGSKYKVFSSGKIWKEEHITVRIDGVIRKWKAQWQPTRVRKADKGRGGGYVYVDLDNKTYLLHRVIAGLFVPNPNNLPDVNHKDGNRQNNNASNLEWISKSDNQKHAYKELGRKRKHKLTDEQLYEISRLRNEEGLRLKDIASMFGIAFQTVSDIARGNRFIMRK